MQFSVRVPKALLVILGIVLVVGGVGVGAYLLGENSADADAAREEGHAEGYDEGRDAGYDAGYDSGFEDGQEKGKPLFTYDQGLRDGKKIGYNDGYKDGGSDALGVGSFDWLTGTLYIVEIAEGPAPLDYHVESQLQMDAREEYEARGTAVFSGPID